MARKQGRRAPVSTQIDPVAARPTADAVDTYVRPDTSGADKLVRALGELDPSVNRFSAAFMDDYASEQRALGEKAAREAHKTGLQMGAETREGKLPMQDNRFFLAGVNEEWGRAIAGDWRSDWEAALNGDPKYAHLKNSTDLSEYDKAVAQHRTEFLDRKVGASRDSNFELGFGKMSDAYWEQARMEFARGIEGKLGEKADAAVHARTMQIVQGLDPETDKSSIIYGVNRLAQGFVAMGRPEKNVYSQVALAIIDAAKQKDDPVEGQKLLDLAAELDGEVGDGGAMGRAKLSQHAVAAGMIEKARDDLSNEQLSREERAYRAKQRYEQERKDALALDLRVYFEKSGADARPSKELREKYKDVAEFDQMHANMQASAQMARNATSEWAMKKAMKDIVAPEGRGPLTPAEIMLLPNIHRNDLFRLLDLAEQERRLKESGGWNKIFNSPVFQNELAVIKGALNDQMLNIAPLDRFTRQGNAISQLMVQVMEVAENGKWEQFGGEPEQAKWLRAVGQTILEANLGNIGLRSLDPAQSTPYAGGGRTPGKLPDEPPGAPATPTGPSKGALNLPTYVVPGISTDLIQAVYANQPGAHEQLDAIMQALPQKIPPENTDAFLRSQSQLLKAQKR